MRQSMRSRAGRQAVGSVLVSLSVVVGVTGCSPSTQVPVGGASTGVSLAPQLTSNSTWTPLVKAINLGMHATMYQEKVAITVSQGSVSNGFTVYGRVNPPNKISISLHQNGYNFNFYQQGLSAFDEQDTHWQQTPARSELNLFPSYRRLVDAAERSGQVPIVQLKPAQYVVDEYCNVYQASIPATLIQPLNTLDSSYHQGDMTQVLYTFYVGQKDGQLRQVITSSVGSTTGVGSVLVQSNTILFAINQKGSAITLDPNLYSALLYQY
jgi:hypothetical protein